MIAQLTIPSAIAYGAILCLFAVALSDLFEVRVRNRALRIEGRQKLTPLTHRLSHLLRERNKGMTIEEASRQLIAFVRQLSSSHPAVALVRMTAEDPEIAHSKYAQDAYMNQTIEDALGDLNRRIQFVASTAGYVGLMGTLIGFGTGTIILSETNDQRQMLAALALALGTTFLGCVVSLIEKFNESALHRLEDSLELRMMPFMSWGSLLFDPYNDLLKQSKDNTRMDIEPPLNRLFPMEEQQTSKQASKSQRKETHEVHEQKTSKP